MQKHSWDEPFLKKTVEMNPNKNDIMHLAVF